MSTFLYFAYGSNMLMERLKARCKSAKFASKATACGYTLRYWKESNDKSGKATLVEDSAKIAYGVVYEIDTDEQAELDKYEGAGAAYKTPGYQRVKNFNVIFDGDDQPQEVVTYLANAIVKTLRPYDWYVALVKAGAAQNDIQFLQDEIKFEKDLDHSRESLKDALCALSEASQLASMQLDHYKTQQNKRLNW